MEKRNKVRGFVADLLQKKGDCRGFADGEGLLTNGRFDSIDALDVVVFLESEYGVNFGERQFDQGELDSIDNIVGLIESR